MRLLWPTTVFNLAAAYMVTYAAVPAQFLMSQTWWSHCVANSKFCSLSKAIQTSYKNMQKQIYRLNLFWPFVGTSDPKLGPGSRIWISETYDASICCAYSELCSSSKSIETGCNNMPKQIYMLKLFRRFFWNVWSGVGRRVENLDQ